MHGPINVKRETCLVRNGIRALDQADRSSVTMAPELSWAMDQAVSRRIFTVQSGVQFQTIPCRMSVEQKTLELFCLTVRLFPLSWSSLQGSIHIYLSIIDAILKLSSYRPGRKVETPRICRKSAH